jgi:hypothetical protein
MKTFKEFLMTEDQVHFSRVMDSIPKEKRAAARKAYRAARNKGFLHASAMTLVHQLHKEDVDSSTDQVLEMTRSRFAVVGPDGNPRYITDNEESAKRVASGKADHSVRKIFAAKDPKPGVIPIKSVK